jgi:hypothetical protein
MAETETLKTNQKKKKSEKYKSNRNLIEANQIKLYSF